ncbi:FHA domain-containing protein, partial [Chloroflexota bacterium]
MSQFLVQDGKGVRWVPVERQMMVGRSPSSHLVLNSATASRRHAWVWLQGASAVIEDLGSTHGTYVNGQLVTVPRALAPNDVITVGDARLTFVTHREQYAESPEERTDRSMRGDAVRTPPSGVPVVMASRVFCPTCGADNHPQATFCGNCGHTMSYQMGQASQWGPGSGQRRARRSGTPVEVYSPMPFPEIPTRTQRARTGTWLLILMLAILAVILLAMLGMLFVLA